MEISIKLPDDSNLSLELDKSQTILSLKTKILTKNPSLPPTFQLVYLGKILKDDRTIETSSIASHSVLNIIHKSPLIQVFIRKLGGYKYTIDIEPSCTVMKLKSSIRKKTGFPEQLQKLMFNKIVLEDEFNVRDYGIDDKSTLNVMLCIGENVEIIVKWEARELNLVLSKSDKVKDLKNKISNEFCIETEMQVLVWHGMRMDDKKSLEFYNFESKGIVNLLVYDKIQVFIILDNQTKITLDVKLSMTLDNLKLLITEKTTIKKFNIFFNKIPLKDDEINLSEYGIKKHSKINIFESVQSEDEAPGSRRPLVSSFNAFKDNSDSILSPN